MSYKLLKQFITEEIKRSLHEQQQDPSMPPMDDMGGGGGGADADLGGDLGGALDSM